MLCDRRADSWPQAKSEASLTGRVSDIIMVGRSEELPMVSPFEASLGSSESPWVSLLTRLRPVLPVSLLGCSTMYLSLAHWRCMQVNHVFGRANSLQDMESTTCMCAEARLSLLVGEFAAGPPARCRTVVPVQPWVGPERLT